MIAMDAAVQTAIIGGVAGLLTGAVASLVAPWVNWQVERRRQEHSDKKARLQEWRAGLALAEAEKRTEDRNFKGDTWYLSLRPHLQDAVRHHVEYVPRNWATLRGDTPTRDPIAELLSGEIDRISKDWSVP